MPEPCKQRRHSICTPVLSRSLSIQGLEAHVRALALDEGANTIEPRRVRYVQSHDQRVTSHARWQVLTLAELRRAALRRKPPRSGCARTTPSLQPTASAQGSIGAFVCEAGSCGGRRLERRTLVILSVRPYNALAQACSGPTCWANQ